ncbi:hypothetical protein BaRGS_00035899 [Batillaria attramentaria]|uniref:Uncharacterized protein n=1 Tax=Batillaria attramentaria TaxID=370345 RepID=A0ABD0JEQ1_9CAEN
MPSKIPKSYITRSLLLPLQICRVIEVSVERRHKITSILHYSLTPAASPDLSSHRGISRTTSQNHYNSTLLAYSCCLSRFCPRVQEESVEPRHKITTILRYSLTPATSPDSVQESKKNQKLVSEQLFLCRGPTH